LKNFVPILKNFLETNESQIVALEEVQRFFQKNVLPKGFIAHIFDFLYKNNLVRFPAFDKWEKNVDPGHEIKAALEDYQSWREKLQNKNHM